MWRPPFADRFTAGRELGEELVRRGYGDDALVLGLARGGVEVAFEVARVLGCELDVMVVRKVGHPSQPELGLGAIAEDGDPVFDPDGLDRSMLTPADLAGVVAAERAESRRRVAAYRGDRPAPEVAGRTVVLVDDGIATGVTARAALRALRARGAGRLVLAAPVASDTALAQLAPDADESVALVVPDRFWAVSKWYDHFDQTSDDAVVRLLSRA
ncbi:MAG: phosphoribosyltransferase [Actinomycetes bacterium]